MITRTAARWQTSDWQSAMKNMIQRLDELCEFIQTPIELLDSSYQAMHDFPLRVPRAYAALIEPGKPDDPLLLQVLPQTAETLTIDGFVSDPLQEAAFNKVPGLIHKYQGRVLLIASPACAIHCRYCFRRHFPYQANTPGLSHWHKALDYIAADTTIHEVILSGGDPLSASDDYLQQLIEKISRIDHIRYLRIHSRLPAVIPQRITDNLLKTITNTRLQTSMVLHINHANEISPDVAQAAALIRQYGIRLLNQTVLLRGINDTLRTQQQLLQTLHELNIQAYYLHLLDPVEGAGHFQVDTDSALALYEDLRRQTPGFMLPRLAREEPHAPYKTWLADKPARNI